MLRRFVPKGTNIGKLTDEELLKLCLPHLKEIGLAPDSLTQEKIDKNGLYGAKIIIDGVGVLKHFSFSSKTVYHEVGDGSLKALIK